MTLSVLSYNVHGLFWPAAKDKKVRMPAIGQRVQKYDLVLFQEDFMEKSHRALTADLPGFEVRRGNGRQGHLRFLGSGLTVLWKAPLWHLTKQTNVDFNDCQGRFRPSTFHDCWANKGFLHLRFRLYIGAEIDVVALHLDAGETIEDRRARERQLARLESYLQSEAAGRPLILGGDFNIDTDSEERGVLTRFQNDLGLKDSGARPRWGFWAEHVDYLLYRSSEEMKLELLAAATDEQFTLNGSPLSDHPAIYALFKVVAESDSESAPGPLN